MSPGLQKSAIEWNSLRLFWIGVPESIILRRVLRASNILEVLFPADLRRCPSSQIIKPMPGLQFEFKKGFHSDV